MVKTHHRGVGLVSNLKEQKDYLATQLGRLITSVEGRYIGSDNNTMKIQKEWYGQQLVGAGDATYGFINFTVTNKSYFDKQLDELNHDQDATHLEYRLHIKQNSNVMLSTGFAAASIFFSTRRGAFDIEHCDIYTNNGNDIETLIVLRDFIEKVKPALEAFNATDATLIAQNVPNPLNYTTMG